MKKGATAESVKFVCRAAKLFKTGLLVDQYDKGARPADFDAQVLDLYSAGADLLRVLDEGDAFKILMKDLFEVKSRDFA